MSQQNLSPAEAYKQYLSPAISDPWTRVLLEYAAPQPGERVLDVALRHGYCGAARGTHGWNTGKSGRA